MDGFNAQSGSTTGDEDAAPPFPLLIVGGSADDLPPLDGLAYVDDPSQPYAGVAVTGSAARETLGRDLAVRHQFMAPVMDFAAALDGRADFAAPAATPDALRAGLAAFLPVLRRLEELPEIAGSPDLHGLAILGLAYTRQTPIRAAWSAHTPVGVRYPLLAGIPGVRDLLSQLFEAQLLRRRFFDRVHLCNNCESARLIAREVCVNCGSAHLAEEALVHHYKCGYQAAEPEFLERGFVCPKCNQLLNHFGVDYDKPGSVMVCRECGTADHDPPVRFACLDCGHETPGAGAVRRDWFHYELTDDGVQAVLAGQLPQTGFERLLERYRQARPLREFVALVEHDLDTARRYERPFALIVMTVENLTELRGTLGIGEAGRVVGALVAQVVEILRETDIVAARADQILIAMPETAPDSSQIALNRLRQRIAETIDADLRLVFEVHSRDDAGARLTGGLGA